MFELLTWALVIGAVVLLGAPALRALAGENVSMSKMETIK